LLDQKTRGPEIANGDAEIARLIEVENIHAQSQLPLRSKCEVPGQRQIQVQQVSCAKGVAADTGRPGRWWRAKTSDSGPLRSVVLRLPVTNKARRRIKPIG